MGREVLFEFAPLDRDGEFFKLLGGVRFGERFSQQLHHDGFGERAVPLIELFGFLRDEFRPLGRDRRGGLNAFDRVHEKVRVIFRVKRPSGPAMGRMFVDKSRYRSPPGAISFRRVWANMPGSHASSRPRPTTTTSSDRANDSTIRRVGSTTWASSVPLTNDVTATASPPTASTMVATSVEDTTTGNGAA